MNIKFSNKSTVSYFSFEGGAVSKLLIVIALLIVSLNVQAQTANGRFLSWDFSAVSATNITTWPVYFGNTTYVDTVGDVITQGAGLNPGATAVAGAMTFQGINSTTEAAAVTNADYVEFQITPKAGFEVRLDSLIYRWQYQIASSTINAFVRTSLDNYATTIGNVAGLSSATAFGNNVSKITFANPIYIQTSVTIRLYLWNANNQNRDFRFTDGTTNNSFNHDISFWGRTSVAKTLMQAFDFSSSLGSETTRPTYTCDNLRIDTAGIIISRGAGLTAQTTTAGSYGANSFNTASQANAIAGNDFFEFALKPKPGYEYSLDRILVRYFAATGISNYALRSSQDNYAANIATGTLTQNANTTGLIALTTPLSTDSSITYRLYLWTTGTANLQFRFTDGTANNTFNYDIAMYGDVTTATIPQVTLSAVGITTTCLGGGVSLKVSTIGGTAPFTVWLKDNFGNQRIHTQSLSDTTFTIFPQSDRIYTLDSVKDVMNHKATQMSGTVSVTVTSSPVTTSVGTFSRTLNHLDGYTLTYANGDSCKSWVRITDSVGGTNPGSTTCLAEVLSTNLFNSTARTYLRRRINITPTTNGVARVSLFFSQDDFTAFNSLVTYQEKMPINPGDTVGIKSKLRIRRTTGSVESASTTQFSPDTVIWNANNSTWEVSFRVNDGILAGNYYVSPQFTSTKLVTGLTHIATAPVPGNTVVVVKVDWDSLPGVAQYRMRFRPQGNTNWNVSTITGSERTLTNLAFNTTYEVQIRAYESQQVQGEYTTTYTFTTPQEASKLPACTVPSNIISSVTSPTTVTLTWAGGLFASGYNVQLRAKNTLTWGGASTSSNTITFNSLAPATTYEFRIRKVCEPGATETSMSAFSAVDTFVTPAISPCGTVTGLSTVTANTNGAVLKWNKVNFATSYFVQVRLKNTATWGGMSTGDTSITFNSLSSSSIYEYRVRANCNNAPALTTTNMGLFSAIAEFSTLSAPVLGACLPPSNIQATPTTNTVNLTWNAASNGASYFLNIKPTASLNNWGGLTVSALNRTLTGLSPNTSYTVRIRTNCTPGTTTNGMSMFSDTMVFVTNALANKFETGTVSQTAVRMYPNPTRDWVHIDYTSETEAPIYIQLRDMTGRLLKTVHSAVLVGDNPIDIDMHSLSNGMYMIQISQNGSIQFTHRIQKAE